MINIYLRKLPFFIIIKYNATIINKNMRGKFNNYLMKKLL